MEYKEYMHGVLVREIRDRTNEVSKGMSFMTADDVDEIIWDIEKLIAEYRENAESMR